MEPRPFWKFLSGLQNLQIRKICPEPAQTPTQSQARLYQIRKLKGRCPVGISLSILTQTLWDFSYVLYSVLWTYSRCFFEPNCFEENEEMSRLASLAVGIWMAKYASLDSGAGLCHIWCVTMMWLDRRWSRPCVSTAGTSCFGFFRPFSDFDLTVQSWVRFHLTRSVLLYKLQ